MLIKVMNGYSKHVIRATESYLALRKNGGQIDMWNTEES